MSTVGVTLDEARDHVADVRNLDQLAHAIALAMVDTPRSPRIKGLVKKYSKLRDRVEAFKTRLETQGARSP